MRPLLKRAVSGVAALGLGAAFVPLFAGAASAVPGAQPDPTLSASATPTAPFGFTVSGGAFCDGTGGQGWRAHTFIVEDGVDLSTLDFTGASASGVPGYIGLDFDASDGTIAAPLHLVDQAAINIIPNGTPAGLLDPADLGGFNFDPSAGWNLVDGTYQIGFACTGPGNSLQQWWSNTVTIDADGSPNPFMVEGTQPDAPTLTSVVPDSGECTVNFTPGSPEAGDSFRVEANDGVNPVTSATGTSSPITITGLTNGVNYSVTVFAVSPAGETASTNTLPCVPETNGGAVQGLVVFDSGTDDGAGETFVDVDWDAPAASSCSVVGYTVDAVPAGTPVQPSPAGDATSARVTGVPTNSSVTVTVTPTFAPGCTGTPASVPAFVATGNIVVQDIDVTRPIGALVLTQVCGTNGALPAEGTGAPATFGDPDAGTSNTPGTRDDQDLTTAPLGFARPGALEPIAANGSSSVGAPNTPAGGEPSLVVDPAGGGIQDQAAADDDPAYAAYPYPTNGSGVASPAAETHCGLDLGVAELVTHGSGAGQFFAADAAMNQVTIVDTRNVDAGWTVTGEMADFVASSEAGEGAGTGVDLDSFSGDFLGWTPVVTGDTPAFDDDADATTAPYDQQVVAGVVVGPSTIDGLGDGATLATAAPGDGLGSAILDARIKLLIPVTADAGVYEGSLRFSAL